VKKRIAFIAAGALVLCVGVYFSTKLWAQPAAQPQPPAQTRVGILNMGYVLKNYAKVNNYTEEMKGHFTQFDAALKGMKDTIEARQKQLQDPKLSASDKEAVTTEITRLQREMEDKNNGMKKFVAAKTDEQMVTVYKDIQEAAQRYALSHNLDMVLTHIDAVSDADFLNPGNVMSKMQQRACMPLYYNKSMDVSKDIVDALNKNFQPPARTTPTSTPAPGH
jgi:Skp family chaperone for outer membrane proteins